MNATIINKFGRLTGWNNLTFRFLNRNLEGIVELEYNDNLEMDYEPGAGRMPVGYTEGNYKATASVTLFSEEMVALQASIPKGMRIQDIPPFPGISQYDRNGYIQTDVLQNCKFKDNGRIIKQGDGKIVHKCTLILSHIDWNT
jgi:hypothetical protein